MLPLLMSMALLGATVSWCTAHPGHLAAAHVVVESDGHFTVAVNLDVLAFALNDIPSRIDDSDMNALLDGPPDVLQANLEDARQRLLNAFGVLCDGQRADVHAKLSQFPSVADVQCWRTSGPTPRLPVIQQVILEGRLPTTTTTVAFRFPESMGTIVLSVDRPGAEPYSEPLDAGEVSSPLPLKLSQSARRLDAVSDV